MGRARRRESTRKPGDLPERKVTALRLREGPSVVGHMSRTERSKDLMRRAAEVFFVEDGKHHGAAGLSPVGGLDPVGGRLFRPAVAYSGNRTHLTEPRAGQHTRKSCRLDTAVVLRPRPGRLRAHRAARHRADQASLGSSSALRSGWPWESRGPRCRACSATRWRTPASSACPRAERWARSSPSPRA